MLKFINEKNRPFSAPFWPKLDPFCVSSRKKKDCGALKIDGRLGVDILA